ncbi:MAG: ABC transporter substrate-binding protein [Christensenellales bacterium]|jgi:raffinose/stachyose/melibiose transport system substrate-binding protein
MTTKRTIAICCTLVLLLSICLSLPVLAEDKKPVTLETWIVQTDWSEAWDTIMKPRFEAEYPWITLEAVGMGAAHTDYIRTRVASGTVPDVWQVDNAQTYYDAVDEGLLVDLNTMEISKSIPQAYRDSFTYNGKLFGLTQGAAFSVLYLNMKVLEEAGWETAPANWEEFIRCCEDIKTKTGVAPLTLAGDKTTTCWMLFELIIGNVAGDQLGLGVYETQFLDGTFDFTAYPELAARLAQVAPYMLTGTATMTEDDVTAAMTDGAAAMCIAGNWTANNICSGIETAAGDAKYVKALLAPFNDAGKDVWISVSPETAFGLSNQKADPEVIEAREIFFNWVFQPENFAIIQNARGTVPVLETLTEEQIKLPDAISEIVPAMNAAKFVKMGFNLWTSEFMDGACTALKDVYSGNREAADAVNSMAELLKTSNRANAQ